MNKDYKRLTIKDNNGDWCVWEEDNCPHPFEALQNAIDRLAEIEDKIENGTLIELPCKVGDMMYEVIEGLPIQEWKVETICFDRAHPKGVIWAERTSALVRWKFWIEDCGTKWFATKSEAEAKVRELKGERE